MSIPVPIRPPSFYRLAQVALDALCALLAILLAFSIRFEGAIPERYGSLIQALVLVGIPSRSLIQWGFGVYHQIWRLFGRRDFWTLLQAVSLYSLVLLCLNRLLLPKLVETTPLPLGVAIMDWSFCLAGMVFLRFLRSCQTRQFYFCGRQATTAPKRLLLLGAGQAGAQIVREIRQNPTLSLQVVAFLDDDPTKTGRQVEGVKVLGRIGQLAVWVPRLQVDEVLITMPSASCDRIQQIVQLAQAKGIPVKILPMMQELLLDRTLTGQIRELRLEDLLGRPEICLDFGRTLCDRFPSSTAQIQDQVVLVTGAGGTIGSELCRQLARLQPRQLILVGRGENSIFHIDQELRQTFPEVVCLPVIADIRHPDRMRWMLHQYRPAVIFHAAAHKHVPLMEQNPTEAIENNTLASAQLALLADQMGVKTFVLISTDKAVAPSNFMGLSKRLAELLISAIAHDSDTRFLTVRFGNVLGSRGSVVPIFQQQIARGGPVTVTDPNMTRYFMTTPEAARLVIQGLAVGESGQTLILDMGKPMRIYALAEQLIRLAGYRPGKDIEIRVTGIRPGEKLHEDLVDTDEVLQKTAHPRIYRLINRTDVKISVQAVLSSLQLATKAENSRELWDASMNSLAQLKGKREELKSYT